MTDELVIEHEISVSIDRRYPIGPFRFDQVISQEEMQQMIQTIEEFPGRLKKLIAQYNEDQLDVPYREGGWTIRQVVHHIADSHMNAYIRFKLALTEERPTIKPYNEKAWAEMMDSKELPVSVSLTLLTALHERWTYILKAMRPEDFERTFFHPEHMKLHHLKEILAMYAWHCNHHFAHIGLIEPGKKASAIKRQSKKASTAKNIAKRKSLKS